MKAYTWYVAFEFCSGEIEKKNKTAYLLTIENFYIIKKRYIVNKMLKYFTIKTRFILPYLEAMAWRAR